ncbi:hypothetical protein BCV72DRAFT_88365 [Rhizopus microsporus var. microsporus]|uniref:Tc1-like transposase DDE domain-containing protein n=1 Tax=Rhizopus microsporus var. microsporus TaxID=86635 RepID=A0A1X0QMI7_RHIZD|nr:hypothetical protein BCV72DRAFT_88365 [Rhizopus microsporus var. microsporus]
MEIFDRTLLFSLKQASKYNLDRNAERTILLRHEIVSKRIEIGVDFQKNYVFIDEAGFHTQMMKGRAWSKVGDPANVKVHNRKGVNISIVVCISPFATINFSKVKPLKRGDAEKIEKEFTQPIPKKRKANVDEDDQKNRPKKKKRHYGLLHCQIC